MKKRIALLLAIFLLLSLTACKKQPAQEETATAIQATQAQTEPQETEIEGTLGEDDTPIN